MKFVRALVATAGLLLAVTFVPGAAAQGAPTAPPNTKGADYQRFAKLTFIAEHACDANTFERARETVFLLALDARALVGKRLYPEAYRGHLGHGPAHGTLARARMVAQYKAWSDYMESVDKWQFHLKPPCKQISVPRFSTQTTPVKNYTIVLPDPGKKGSYTASVVDKATGRTFQSTHVSGPSVYNWYLFEGMLPDHVYQLRINGKLQAEFAPMDDGGMFDARKKVKHAAGPKVRIKGAVRKPAAQPQTETFNVLHERFLKNYVIVLPDKSGSYTVSITDKATEDQIAHIHVLGHSVKNWTVDGMLPGHVFQLRINGKIQAEFVPMKEGGIFDARKKVKHAAGPKVRIKGTAGKPTAQPQTETFNVLHERFLKNYVIVLPDKSGSYTVSITDKATEDQIAHIHVLGHSVKNWTVDRLVPGRVYQLRINGKAQAEFVPMEEGGIFDATKEKKQVKEKMRVERHRVKRQSKRHKAIELPTRNLSFEQQQVANAWYVELGKIKRKGLDAARRGDRRAVDSAIQRAAIVITDAKKGDGALGRLPTVIRNQIAKEGRRVVDTLSGGAKKSGVHRQTGAAKNPDGVKKGTASMRAGRAKYNLRGPRGPLMGTIAFFRTVFGVTESDLKEQGEERYRKRMTRKLYRAYDRALEGLREGNEEKFTVNYRYLRNPIHQTSVFSEGLRWHSAGGFLGTWLLDKLPDHFVSGFAYMRSDGTIAADPDPFIQLMLARDGDLVLSRGGGPGEGAK